MRFLSFVPAMSGLEPSRFGMIPTRKNNRTDVEAAVSATCRRSPRVVQKYKDGGRLAQPPLQVLDSACARCRSTTSHFNSANWYDASGTALAGSATVPVAPYGVPPDGFAGNEKTFSGTRNAAGGTPRAPHPSSMRQIETKTLYFRAFNAAMARSQICSGEALASTGTNRPRSR